MKLSRHHLAALAAFLIWGFFPIPLRWLAGYASGQILFFRVLISLGLLLLLHGLGRRAAVQAVRRQWQAAPAAERRRLALTTGVGGLLLTSNWLLFIYVVNQVSVQAGSFAYLICPILTALLGVVVLGEILRLNQWLAIGLSALSCALLGAGEVKTLLMSLVVASTYAAYLISQRRLQGYDRLVLLTVQLLLAALLILPVAPLLGAQPLAGFQDGHLLAVTALLSLGFTVVPLFLNLYALNALPSGTVGIMMYLNPLVSFALAFLYFGERATTLQVVAYGVILLSVALYNLAFRRRTPSTNP
ncbi:chloramphenicol-sensitive protein RarD [Hymenobacter luteus]|uniref:Chloramphenicol-sensitive protein RarD n=2 Tax=Hymenobacter TaxID=89966 RepID=A0A7W9T3C6_9BACT|nr:MULTISPECIES: EamA family transporter [Hymenobacter]MBB4602422.1 chloramphenicol-sensitive protein RarD [Hymenobacter latericoloratus]MBB6060313.1 chloramphenicol-sensitive protein RarD [Hymenobacter luteus]